MNGLIYIALSVLMGVGIANLMKVSQAKGLDFPAFLCVNYLVASLVSLAGAHGDLSPLGGGYLWVIALVAGVMYVACLVIFRLAIGDLGLTMPTALMRLSSVVPTLGSILLFAEVPSPWQALGIGLAFVALPLASKDPLPAGRWLSALTKGLGWALVLFAAYGLTNFLFKFQAELYPLDNPFAFLTLIFAVALLLTLPWGMRRQPSAQLVAWGAALGLCNGLGTYFLVRALATLPGMVAYPTEGIGVIGLATLTSYFIWKERLRRANWYFLGLAAVALALLHTS